MAKSTTRHRPGDQPRRPNRRPGRRRPAPPVPEPWVAPRSHGVVAAEFAAAALGAVTPDLGRLADAAELLALSTVPQDWLPTGPGAQARFTGHCRGLVARLLAGPAAVGAKEVSRG